jgi:hypothetical protein
LTVSGVVYDRRVEEHTFSFGVSGRLYHSNLLLYDRQTESLWSQITAEAVAGRMTGAKLRTVPFVITTWHAWQQQHPQSQVLIERRVPAVLSAVGKTLQMLLAPLRGLHWPLSARPQTSLDELVLGVTVGDIQKAYALDLLARVALLTDKIAETEVRLVFVPGSTFAYATTSTGARLPAIVTYSATWRALYPRSAFFTPSR